MEFCFFNHLIITNLEIIN